MKKESLTLERRDKKRRGGIDNNPKKTNILTQKIVGKKVVLFE